MRTALAPFMAIAISIVAVPAQAGEIQVPAGTSVLLKFLDPVDSATITEGATVKFEVAANVLVQRAEIFRQGTPAQGVVTDVSQPGIFGKNARVHVAYLEVTATDGRPVRLSPLDISADMIRQAKDAGAAGGASLAGIIILGPVGLAAGAFIRGGQVSVPAGAIGTTKVAEPFKLETP
ncbi:MAG TPA: hypothetical protein VJT32_07825 [bacterium]|nr:hypothetical protein [bacterium]